MLNIAKSGEIFVRTIKKIKAGEEINYCYREENCIMKTRQTRQTFFKENANFICACNYCKGGEEDIEAQEKFEKLQADGKSHGKIIKEMSIKFTMNCQNPAELISIIKKNICCHKDLYNLGKKQKAAVSYLYKGVYLHCMIFTINAVF